MLSSLLVNGDGRTEFQTHNCWKPLGHPGSGDLLLAGFRPWGLLSETAAVRGTFPGARPLELPFNPAKARPRIAPYTYFGLGKSCPRA